MVSTSSIVMMFVALILSLAVPIGVWIYMHRKFRLNWKPIAVGIIIFIAFSRLLRPILETIVVQLSDTLGELLNNPLMAALYGSLAAGIFEEIGRYIGFRVILTKFREWKDGIAYGIGHGGIEAVMVGVVPVVQTVIFAFLINAGKLSDIIQAGGEGTAQLEALQEQIPNMPAYVFLLASLERGLAFVFQLALSLVVLYSVKTKRIAFLFYAIALHFAMNFIAVILDDTFGLNGLIAILFMAVVAIASIIFMKRIKPKFDDITDNI